KGRLPTNEDTTKSRLSSEQKSIQPRRSRFHFVASTMKKIILLHLMFKFNPAEYKNNIRKKIDESLINNHDKDQFKEEIIYLSTIETKLDSDQFNSDSKGIINAKIFFCSKYKQTYDNLHSIHHYYQISAFTTELVSNLFFIPKLYE
ncbi:17819_t:CDS:1, partial [Gigaspora margarita]